MTPTNKQKLVIITGPTASGKSFLGVKLAKKYDGYVISADSRQIYKGMDVGTGKITKEEIDNVRHFMLDFVKPDEEFTVGQFKKEAEKIISSKKRLPFLVGGTGLYIDAVCKNLTIPKIKPNNELRSELENKSFEELHKQLETLDPEIIKTIDLKNKRRLIRALEICLESGRPYSEQRKQGKPKYDLLEIGLDISKEELYNRIDKRIDEMIEVGNVNENNKTNTDLIMETKQLLDENYSLMLPSMSGIGYKEIAEYLQGAIDLDEAKIRMSTRTKQYAKRQMTWFKRNKNIHWVGDLSEADNLVEKFLAN
ncbi:MAG: tRNA (adenosine(37)-N6)-dimethylallyltransferase MiaA [bacterium]